MSDLKQAVERLERDIDDVCQCGGALLDTDDLRLVLSALSKAEARLAALRPLVRAAVLVHEPNLQHEGTWMMLPACVGRNSDHMVRMEDVQSVELEARALDPALIAWAKGGE